MGIFKQYKIPFLAAAVHWYITTVLQLDRLFFDYEAETNLYLFIKLMYFLVLVMSWCFGFCVYQKYKEKYYSYRRGVQIFGIYAGLSLFILLLLWPGTWAWDDLMTLNGLPAYQWYAWQHILTSIYQMVLLQLLPFPGGIILLQNILISICAAFFVVKVESCFPCCKLKNPVMDLILKISPFFLPPVLMYQNSGYRMGMYVYLELTVLCILVCAVKEKEEWKYSYLFLFCFLCVVVASWRTEGVFYIPVTCMILVTLPQILSVKKKMIGICMIIAGFLFLTHVQNNALGDRNYEVMATIRPCVELVKAADCMEDKEPLANIDKVLDLDIIYDNPQSNGEELYWGFGVARSGYTREEFQDYRKAFIQLAVRHPMVVIKERTRLFLDSIGIHGSSRHVTNVNGAVHLFQEGIGADTPAGMFQDKKWVANKAIFPQIRENVICMLGFQESDAAENGAYRVVWNGVIPLVVIIIGSVMLLIKKQWHWFLICALILIRVFVTVLTQPSAWFMYFLSVYFDGYVLLIYGLIHLSNSRFRKFRDFFPGIKRRRIFTLRRNRNDFDR